MHKKRRVKLPTSSNMCLFNAGKKKTNPLLWSCDLHLLNTTLGDPPSHYIHTTFFLFFVNFFLAILVQSCHPTHLKKKKKKFYLTTTVIQSITNHHHQITSPPTALSHWHLFVHILSKSKVFFEKDAHTRSFFWSEEKF